MAATQSESPGSPSSRPERARDSARDSHEAYAGRASEFAKKGFAHFQANEFELAVMEYSKAIAQSPDAVLHYCRGSMHLPLGRLDDGIDDLNEAIRLQPGMEIAHRALRIAYGRQGGGSHPSGR